MLGVVTMPVEAKDDMKGAIKSTLLCCTPLMGPSLRCLLGNKNKAAALNV